MYDQQIDVNDENMPGDSNICKVLKGKNLLKMSKEFKLHLK